MSKQCMNMKHLRRRINQALSVLLGACMMFSLFGCGYQKLDGDGMVYKPAYVSISQDEAKLMMKASFIT